MARNEEVILLMDQKTWELDYKKDIDRKFKRDVKRECNRRMKVFYTDLSITLVILAVPLCMVAHFFLSTGY